MWTLPANPLTIPRPEENPSESKKFADNGQWFMDKARWIAMNYYNSFSMPTLEGNLNHSIVQEMIANRKYYYAVEPPGIFNYMTQNPMGGATTVPYIRGQEVRQLVDHMKGNVEEMVAPLEKTISCESISDHAVKKKKAVFDKLEAAHALAPIISQISQGVQFAPAGDMDYTDKTKVAEAAKKIRETFERTGTILTRSVYYENSLRGQFVDDAMNVFIGNLAATNITCKNGKVVHTYVPCENAIYDFSSDEYGRNQNIGGYIVPMTLEEILANYDLKDDWKKEIEDVLYNNAPYAADFMNYYNLPFQNMKWWYTDQKWTSVATVYWIGKRDTRYKLKTTKTGGKRLQKIDDDKVYRYDDGTSEMGRDIKGKEVWMVHYAKIAGNKYLLEYGYDEYQVRPHGEKQKPIIPMFFYCPSKMGGMVRSVVSRLKYVQEQLNAVTHKIRQLSEKDLGRCYVFMGEHLGEATTVQSIANDFAAMNITVIPSTGDSKGLSVKDIVGSVDITQNEFIGNYIQLKREYIEDMRAIVSLPSPVLGQQTSTIGKGVQERTISQSTLANVSLYAGLFEFYRIKLQYSANKYKMILAENPKDYVVPLSANQTEVINVTKDFRYEDLYVYIKPNDSVEGKNKQIYDQLLFSYAQNSQNGLAAAKALQRGIKLLKYQSLSEGIEDLDAHIEQEERKTKEQFGIEQAMAQQQQQMQLIAQQNIEAMKALADLKETIVKTNLSKSWDAKIAEIKGGIDTKYMIDDAIIQQSLQQQQPQESTQAQ